MHQFDVTSLFMFRSFPFISYTIMDFPDFANHFRFAAFGFHGKMLVFNVIPNMRCHPKVKFVFSISVCLFVCLSLSLSHYILHTRNRLIYQFIFDLEMIVMMTESQ